MNQTFTKVFYTSLDLSLNHKFAVRMSKTNHQSTYECTRCFGTYLYSVGTQHGKLLKWLVTVSRMTYYILLGYTGNCQQDDQVLIFQIYTGNCVSRTTYFILRGYTGNC